MKQPHIQLDESLNVRYAILPGDPRRAERIASHMSEVEDLGMNPRVPQPCRRLPRRAHSGHVHGHGRRL